MSQPTFDFDFVVVGSGFGGSVAAYRLAEKGYKVAVMEMGLRWTAENLPTTSWTIHRWFWRPKLALRGFFNMRFFRHVTVLHGCAVGGGSVTYAATSLRPPDKVWGTGTWSGLADWEGEMPRHYESARAIRSTGRAWRSCSRRKGLPGGRRLRTRTSADRARRDRPASAAGAA